MVNSCSQISYYTAERVGNIHQLTEIDRVLEWGEDWQMQFKKRYDFIFGVKSRKRTYKSWYMSHFINQRIQ